jgi:hypothetical protein
MAKGTINLGTTPNDETGTNLRAAGQIINDNFTELYEGKEDTSNKKTDIETNKTSDAFYPSIKSIVDWVINLFVKGSGTENYLPKFGVGGKVVGNSQIFDNGTTVSVTKLTQDLGQNIYGNAQVNFALLSNDALAADKGGSIGFGGIFIGTSSVLFGAITGRKETATSGFADGYLGLHTWQGIGLKEKVRITSTGNVGIGTTTPTEKLHTVGNGKFTGSVQVGDNTAVASVSNVGAIRYRSDTNNSYAEMVMQTGAATYAWTTIVQNTW